MAVAGTLEIQMMMGLARLSSDITQAKGMVGTLARDVDRAAATMKNALGSIFAGLSVTGLVALSKSTIDAMDHLNDLSKATNLTVETLAGLKVAAKQSGGDLDGLAASINKLAVNMGKAPEKFAALGVSAKDPLEAFKQLSDVFVSIQDPQLRAAVGAEALGKSWASAAPLLSEGSAKIGEMVEAGTKASGVTSDMAKQADELNDKLALLIGSGGLLTSTFAPLIPLLIAAVDGLTQMREGASGAGNIIATALVESLRAVLVVGGNVGFVLKGIGTEIGGLAAQAVAIMGGDFRGAMDIGERMKRDAEAARVAFDTWEQKILDVGSASTKTAAAVAGMSEEDMEAARIATAAAAAAKRKAEAFLHGEEAAKKLAKATKENEDALKAYVRAQETALAMDEEIARQITDLEDKRGAAILATEKVIEQIQFETSLIGLSNDARETAIALRALETSGIGKQDAAYEELARRLKKNLGLQQEARARQTAQAEELRNQVSVWNEIGDAAGNFFADLIMNGKSAFDNLKKWVKQLLAEMIALFAKRWILNMAAAGSMGGAGSALAGGGGGSSLAGTALSMGGDYLAGAAGFAGVGTVAEFGAAASGAIPAAAIGSEAVAAGVGVNTFAASAGSAMSGVYSALAAIPVWGWIAMAVIAAVVYFSGRGGGPKPGGSYMGDFDPSGNLTGTSAVPGTDNGRFFTPNQGDSAMQELTNTFAGGFFNALSRYSGTTGGMSFGFGFDQDPQGTADSRVSAMVRDSSGNIVYSHTQTAGRDDEDFQRAVTLEMQRALLAGLQASDLPESIGLVLDGLDPLTATIEEITEAFRLADVAAATLNLGIRGLDFQTLQTFQRYGEDISDTFARVANTWAWFQENFTSDAVRLERAQQQLSDGFAALNLEMPTSTDAFRELVESLDITDPRWQGLMDLSPAFLRVTNAAGDTADAVDGLAESLNDAVVMTMDLQLRIQEDVRRSRESQLDAVIGARSGLQSFLNSTMLNSNLTTLDPNQRLSEARRQYEEVLLQARGGDLGAAGRLGGVSETYLQIAREMFASSSRYVDIFEAVTGGVRGVDARLERDQHMLEATLGMASTMVEVRDLLIDIRDGTYESPKQVSAAVRETALSTKRR